MRDKILKSQIRDYFKVDKELIIIFLLVAMTGFIFFFVSNQRAFLNFFYLPVLIGAYFFGKRYATHSAILSIILVSVVAHVYPSTFAFSSNDELYKWLDIVTWGGFLFIVGYYMGLLFEKKEETKKEIKMTYRGIIEMLSLIIDSVDKQTQSHSYRVSVIAEMIAREMRCPEVEVENIRIAALLHDLGKMGVSAEILHKIGGLSTQEREDMKIHATLGADVLKPVGGRVLQLLPLILHHHEKYDGKGYHGLIGKGIPLGARIIAVADVYDALTTDRPYRTGLSPLQAKNEIVANAGTHFAPEVVEVFDSIFQKLESEIPMLPTKLNL
ncbi:MAG: HD-GYP domain-containing protein [Nitrospirota bacterium]